MQLVLEGIAHSLSTGKPSAAEPIPHAWYDSNYVGMDGDKVAAWRGYSINLREFGAYRTFYINYVSNSFSVDDNAKLFGEAFAQAISPYDEYICGYVTSCSVKSISEIPPGFTYKRFERSIHPSWLCALPDFLMEPAGKWIRLALLLLDFQARGC